MALRQSNSGMHSDTGPVGGGTVSESVRLLNKRDLKHTWIVCFITVVGCKYEMLLLPLGGV